MNNHATYGNCVATPPTELSYACGTVCHFQVAGRVPSESSQLQKMSQRSARPTDCEHCANLTVANGNDRVSASSTKATSDPSAVEQLATCCPPNEFPASRHSRSGLTLFVCISTKITSRRNPSMRSGLLLSCRRDSPPAHTRQTGISCWPCQQSTQATLPLPLHRK
jgi:hypothetical protein